MFWLIIGKIDDEAAFFGESGVDICFCFFAAGRPGRPQSDQVAPRSELDR